VRPDRHPVHEWDAGGLGAPALPGMREYGGHTMSADGIRLILSPQSRLEIAAK